VEAMMEAVKLDDVRRRLNRQGRRMTPQRAAILEALRATKSHPTAEALYDMVQERLPRISLGTVYRNLQVLVEEGWARRLPAQSGSHHFDGDTSEHHHARCRSCDKIFDVGLPEDPALRARVERQTGIRVETLRIEFEGTCRNCS
jgi:Fur family ferric uptake transcriptional regulator